MGRTDDRDRGQAFTLEGVIASFLVVTALVFALQSVLLTPITVGPVDESTQTRIRTEANDILRVMADKPDRDLAFYARYWSPVNRTFVGAESPDVGYGTEGPPGQFGEMLRESFTAQGRSYNIILHYRNGTSPTDSETVRMVYQGEPSDSAVVASYTVTLYDDMSLTGPHRTDATLADMDTNATNNENGYFYAPDAADGLVYNVIEVRIIVW